ncbi:helix-turn-helix transcriptional regulator [Paenibacillus glucanolyticus]|uniref:helix-turn-helix transcriptional regulator n=1 Tax=Paenibacillus glucanolyticus TaxID=59843 RepID=UPI0035D6468F
MRPWLKQARENATMTHEQVAEKAEISRSYYTNIENGTKTPSVKAAKSIAIVLGFPWENFFSERCSFEEQLIGGNQKEVG